MESIAELDESILLSREALGLSPPGHGDYSKILNELSWSLISRYEAQGLIEDLEESIRLGRQALALQRIGYPRRYNPLETLAKSLHFQPEHLDEALQLSRESVSLISPGHDAYCQNMMTLATILLRHHERSGASDKLEEAISVCTEALSSCPPTYFLHPRLLALQVKLAEVQSSSSSTR
ncbi:hypothetical protein FA13DRAFT_1727067 [Coprinellus micaceus]|uniref:TPR-like protein n=1 Tax=Coprinellus micaceus TaxID=71717 RepID=A0A4Y7TS36_COPMI|nr:hypothetical protein FA13DRAFT_1727067 [Coprinellus micaceus]